MAQSKLPYLIGTIIVVAGGVWMAQAPTPDAQPPAYDAVESTAPLSAAESDSTAMSPTAPQVQAYEAYQAFTQHSRRFFSEAERLDAQQRQAEMRQLLDGTNQFEQQGKLVPMEALVLKLAMLRYSSSSDDDYKIKAKALIDHYKAQSDLREQAWLANPDPQFVEYKRQEQDIVREVMAMTVIPDGLSRDEYLRQRLEQARIATMGSGSGP